MTATDTFRHLANRQTPSHHRCMKHALLSLALTTLPVCATAQTSSAPPQITVTQGIFCEIVSVATMDAPGTAAGQIELYDHTPEFQWLGSTVPTVPGLSFGVRVDTQGGLSFGGTVITLTHPPLTGTDITEQSYVTTLGGEGPSVNAYTFDLPQEMVTGTWTFTAQQNGRELYKVQFDVVPPSQVPQIALGCEGNLLS
ncbi:DUF3859 domain-containing protein [Puniceibacterium sediminis]|uniref:DUF3859 domain-containing protein n=1 Tax=Puniceibacterium sediminis TaxID=1608407 RepID=A0A238WJF3_9RHOB|nr:DUF3859 domain-containing protein [Puniceibacterium sediminis]SNR46364.1 protein of unknown function [Puniceibacterium sediminis]